MYIMILICLATLSIILLINNSKGEIGKITIYKRKIELDWNNDEPLIPYIPE